MKKCIYCFLALLAGCGSGGNGNRPPPCAVDECFHSDPGWTSFNIPSNNNDFGFQLSNLAGGTEGEVGGFFSASLVPIWYGDIDIGSFDRDDMLSASGILNIVSVDMNYNNNVSVGHFDRGGFQFGRTNGIGFQILEDGAQIGTSEFRIFYMAGTVTELLFAIDGLDLTRTWSYEYDPSAGGFGSISVSVSGPGGETGTHFLTSTERASIGNLDTFGLATIQPLIGALGQAEIYFDDISYTSAATN